MCDFQSDLLLWSRWGFEHVWNLMQTAVCYANNMGGSKSPERKAITKQIWTYCISHNHWLSATLSRARSTPEVEYCVQWRETEINSAENICVAKKPILQRANRHRLTLFHFRNSLTVLKRFLKTNRHKYVTAMSYFTITVLIVTITNSRIWLAITSYYFFPKQDSVIGQYAPSRARCKSTVALSYFLYYASQGEKYFFSWKAFLWFLSRILL